MSSYYHSTGTHTNPAYQGTAEKQRNDPVILSMNGPGYEEHPKWSWCSTGWSCFTSVCCLSWCGWMGLLMSILSYTDHKSGDYERSRYKNRWAWCCTMTGLVLALLIITAFILVIFVFSMQVSAALCPHYSGLGVNDPFTIFCKANGAT